MCCLGAALSSTAAQVTTRMLDSASAADMASLHVLPHRPPLGTVIHAGGVLRDGLLAKQSASTLREVCTHTCYKKHTCPYYNCNITCKS